MANDERQQVELPALEQLQQLGWSHLDGTTLVPGTTTPGSPARYAHVAAIGWLFRGPRLDAPAIIGMAMIVAGVVVMNLFSKAVAH